MKQTWKQVVSIKFRTIFESGCFQLELMSVAVTNGKN